MAKIHFSGPVTINGKAVEVPDVDVKSKDKSEDTSKDKGGRVVDGGPNVIGGRRIIHD